MSKKSNPKSSEKESFDILCEKIIKRIYPKLLFKLKQDIRLDIERGILGKAINRKKREILV